MAFSTVQHKSATGSSLVPAATFTATPTAGNLLVAAVNVGTAASLPALSMTSAGWTPLTQAAVSARAIRMFWKIAGAGESATVTAAVTPTCPWVIAIAEYAVAGATVNAPAENAQTNASGTTSTPIVTPTAGLIALAVCFVGESITSTWSAQQVNASATGVAVEESPTVAGSSATLFDLPTTSAGTYQGQATPGTAAAGGGAIAVFTALVPASLSAFLPRRLGPKAVGPTFFAALQPVVLASVPVTLDASGGLASADSTASVLTITVDSTAGTSTAAGGTVTEFASVTLVATGGTAATSGTTALTVIVPAATGAATTGGTASAFTETLTATVGSAAASSSPVALTASLVPASGTASTAGSATFTDALIASSGAATTSGTVALIETLPASNGSATTGGTVAFADGLTATNGPASADGTPSTLTITLAAANGTASADGGSVIFTSGSGLIATGGTATTGGTVALSAAISATLGAASADSTAPTLAATFTATTGAATGAGGDSTASKFFVISGGSATTGGTTGLSYTTSVLTGTATAQGGTVTFVGVISHRWPLVPGTPWPGDTTTRWPGDTGVRWAPPPPPEYPAADLYPSPDINPAGGERWKGDTGKRWTP